MKSKKIFIFIMAALAILIITAITFNLRNKDSYKTNVNNQSINFKEFKLEDRTTLFVNNELLIGENIKELENGYYDLKIAEKDGQLLVYLNKLWYETYGSDYIQDEYLAKICRELEKVVDIFNSTEGLDYELYKYIKQNYLNVKQGLSTDNIELEKITISSFNELGQCVVSIRVE